MRSAGCSTIALLGLVTVAALLLLEPVPATAQRVVPRLIEGCPIGYADTRNGRCCSFGRRVVRLQPRQGRDCPAHSFNLVGLLPQGMTRSATPELTVLFDGGCSICLREVTFLRRRDRRGSLGFVDIDAPDYNPAQYQGISYEEAMGRIHAVTASGEVMRDVAVFREAYRLIGLGWLYVPTRWPVVSSFVDWLYGVWAARRLQLTRRPDLRSLCDARQRCRLEGRSS